MRSRDLALGVSVAVIWGVNFVVIDVGLEGVPPLLFAALRFLLVGLLALVVPRPRCGWRWLLAVGLLMSAGQFGLLYLALGAGMPAGIASLVLQAQVPLTIVLATAFFGESVGVRRLVGVLLAVVGLAVVAAARGGAMTLGGFLLVLGAASCWAAGNNAARRSGAGGLSLVVWSALVVPAPLLALSAVTEGTHSWWLAAQHWGWDQSLSTAYTVVLATLVGYGAWNSLLSRHPASSVVPFALLVPVVGLVTAFLAQGEQPSPGTLLGGAVLLLGAALALVPDRRRPEPVVEPTEPGGRRTVGGMTPDPAARAVGTVGSLRRCG